MPVYALAQASDVLPGSSGSTAVVDKVDLLARMPLFAGLASDELARIADLTEDVEVAAGTVLTHEGRYEGWFYLVVAGTVEIARAGAAVDTVGAGDFVGEIALLDDGPRTATATTLTPCELLRVNNSQFDSLLEASPAIRARAPGGDGGAARADGRGGAVAAPSLAPVGLTPGRPGPSSGTRTVTMRSRRRRPPMAAGS